jgi:hypothetical protein
MFTLAGGAVANRFPQFSKTAWAGIPLDVRHFTLSSGALAFSALSLGLSDALQSGLVAAEFRCELCAFVHGSAGKMGAKRGVECDCGRKLRPSEDQTPTPNARSPAT